MPVAACDRDDDVVACVHVGVLAVWNWKVVGEGRGGWGLRGVVTRMVACGHTVRGVGAKWN